jgi:molybdopterin synthase catalytic subunit
LTTILRDRDFDAWEEVSRYQESHLSGAGKYGATACFVGTMRDFSEDVAVRSMYLEHYPGMTDRYLERLEEEATGRWGIMDALIVHRYGEVRPNDPIVLVAVWAAHRGPAFEACRYLLEELKARAPFWKREVLPDRVRWVERNTSG